MSDAGLIALALAGITAVVSVPLSPYALLDKNARAMCLRVADSPAQRLAISDDPRAQSTP